MCVCVCVCVCVCQSSSKSFCSVNAKVTGYSLECVNVLTRNAHLHQTTATKYGAQIEGHLMRTHSQK